MIDRTFKSANLARPLGFMAWVAGYKLFKALLALAGALLVLHFLHRDLALIALNWMRSFGIDEQGRMASRLIEQLTRLTPGRLHLFSSALFVCAAIYVTEGIGLVLKKRWAEWLTVVQTAMWVPVEIYELGRRPSWIKAAVLLLNLAVIAYLLWRLRRDAHQHSQAINGDGVPPGDASQERQNLPAPR